MTESGICPIGDHPFEYEMQAGKQRIYCSEAHRNKGAYERRKLNWQTLTEWRCSCCKLTKPVTDFPGAHNWCRSCHAAKARERREIYGARDPMVMREWELRRYGLTPDAFDAMLAAQGGTCAICRASEPGGRGVWHVDHDHSCHARKQACSKCRRGLLCSRCNIGIGNLRDDPVIIKAALDYITAHRQASA